MRPCINILALMFFSVLAYAEYTEEPPQQPPQQYPQIPPIMQQPQQQPGYGQPGFNNLQQVNKAQQEYLEQLQRALQQQNHNPNVQRIKSRIIFTKDWELWDSLKSNCASQKLKSERPEKDQFEAKVYLSYLLYKFADNLPKEKLEKWKKNLEENKFEIQFVPKRRTVIFDPVSKDEKDIWEVPSALSADIVSTWTLLSASAGDPQNKNSLGNWFLGSSLMDEGKKKYCLFQERIEALQSAAALDKPEASQKYLDEIELLVWRPEKIDSLTEARLLYNSLESQSSYSNRYENQVKQDRVNYNREQWLLQQQLPLKQFENEMGKGAFSDVPKDELRPLLQKIYEFKVTRDDEKLQALLEGAPLKILDRLFPESLHVPDAFLARAAIAYRFPERTLSSSDENELKRYLATHMGFRNEKIAAAALIKKILPELPKQSPAISYRLAQAIGPKWVKGKLEEHHEDELVALVPEDVLNKVFFQENRVGLTPEEQKYLKMRLTLFKKGLHAVDFAQKLKENAIKEPRISIDEYLGDELERVMGPEWKSQLDYSTVNKNVDKQKLQKILLDPKIGYKLSPAALR